MVTGLAWTYRSHTGNICGYLNQLQKDGHRTRKIEYLPSKVPNLSNYNNIPHVYQNVPHVCSNVKVLIISYLRGIDCFIFFHLLAILTILIFSLLQTYIY
jgi:hypothetical protein